MRLILLTGFLALQCTGFSAPASTAFSIQQQNDAAWLMKPNGERFFSLGVCVVSQGASRDEFTPTNPGYAAFRYYDNSNRWAADTLRRLALWRFTTVGGWSDFRALKESQNAKVAFTPVLHVGSTCGVPWWDMWDTNIIARMHQVARDQILPLRDDPRVLGYYSDNEMGWWNAVLFKMTLEHGPNSGQRQRLLKLLRETYHDEWSELLKDFEPEDAQSFTDLDQRGTLFLRPGSNGIRTYRAFLAMIAERYYALVREVIRTYDQRGLILGDRYQSFFYPEVARACGLHVEAASGNLNAAWNDGTFPRYYLDTLHALTGKPIFVSEFYMCARENRSGNKNDKSIFPTVSTQKERAAGFRTTLAELLRMPHVVGADWFQYYDEPPLGRSDGENFNFGLVDVHNKPYEWLTATSAALDLDKMKTESHEAQLDASKGVPRAPRKPLGTFEPLLALKHWDRKRGFVKTTSDFPIADLYICWDRKSIYLGLYAQDIVEEAFYRDKTVPEIDRSEWVISLGDSNPIRARIGARVKPVLNETGLQMASVSGSYMNTRTIAAIEIPARRLGRARLKAGDTIELNSTFFTHCRAYRMEWSGRFTLSAE